MSAADIRKALLEAENHIGSPTIALTKLRFIGEALATILAGKAGVDKEDQETQVNFLRRLQKVGAISKATVDDLHQVRVLGNDAVHQNKGTIKQANEALTLIRRLLKEHLGLAVNDAATNVDTTLSVKARIKIIETEKGATGLRKSVADHALSNPSPTAFSFFWNILVKRWPWALAVFAVLITVLSIATPEGPTDDCANAALSDAARADFDCDDRIANDIASVVTASPMPIVEAESTFFVAAETNIRDRASATLGQGIGLLRRAASVTGVIVRAEESVTSWLRLNDGRGFINLAYLSSEERPTLIREWVGDRQRWSMEGLTPLHARPLANSAIVAIVKDLQSVVLSGVTSDGWVEVRLSSGGVGYFAVTQDNDRTCYILAVLDNPATQSAGDIDRCGELVFRRYGFRGEYAGEDGGTMLLLGFDAGSLDPAESVVGYGRYERRFTRETCHSMLRLIRRDSDTETYVFDQVARPNMPRCDTYLKLIIRDLDGAINSDRGASRFQAEWIDASTGDVRLSATMTSQ